MPITHIALGGGNMAQAIIRGTLNAGVLTPESWGVVDRRPEHIVQLAALGIAAHPSPQPLIDLGLSSASLLLLAVKPQSLDDAAPSIGTLGRAMAQGTLASVLAGTTTARLTTLLRDQQAPLAAVRAMPNTPSAVGKGMSAISPGPGAQPDDIQRVEALFAAVGEVCTIDESLMDAFTAVAGSGPAYLFYLAEAMVQGALEVGFDPDLAHRIARQTVIGAARLLESDPRTPQDLRAAVTSKGGTTFAATETFDSHGVAQGIAAGIIAARNRGQALANNA